ncbi:hypothetical protein LR48_Vigan11g113600 [Vigna angularis]|uniref:DUF3741 domain-containing protein n=2 Tax=Phaseolus angularis TaxID=3914 RepID=A0A0L9VTB8_PHAAN|nr:uncharacterized protein LOC108347117 [Vigna angularis]KAG2380717.1 uncharacterized protein HKW66_Vig0200890 [Vigna angularis]KOM58102.1 hypothetical protein LR48_Vigan11g113600 [Vigna angularis]BAT97400.1 hypothetical protein VIGAN_09083500 [Vigna angularis var. angularis]
MAKAEKPKSGCFPGLLRVLLCAGNATSPPVHPSDHFTESDDSEKAHFTKETVVVKDGSTPGVVARLMGLDSLPNSKWAVKGGSPDSVPRSRSVNFVDYLLEFDASHAIHRRVKTSSSFREVPGLFQNQKGNNLFVLCMDGDKDEEVRKMETGLGEMRKGKRQGSKNKESVSVKKERNVGKNRKISKLKNEPRRDPSSKHGSKGRNLEGNKDLSSVSSGFSKCSSCSNRQNGAASRSRSNTYLPNKHKKELVETKDKRNMRNQKLLLKVESECSLEHRSPVSVADSNDYPFLYETDFLDGSSTTASKSKRVSPSMLSLDGDVEDSASTNKDHTFIDVNKEAEYLSEMMLQIRTLTEHDVRESDCTLKRMRESESFRDICLVFEHKIFDHLLYEVVNEFSELRC